MDQQKIGRFIKTLRTEKGLTQEQLAEALGVTNRSVSRWENGVNLPDIDLLLLLSKYFNIDVGELLDGERKEDIMDKQTESTILKVADYKNSKEQKFIRGVHWMFILAVAALALHIVLDDSGLVGNGGIYDVIAGFSLGLAFGMLILGVILTSRSMSKIRAFKMRLIGREVDKE